MVREKDEILVWKFGKSLRILSSRYSGHSEIFMQNKVSFSKIKNISQNFSKKSTLSARENY